MPRITFQPADLTVDIAAGESVFEVGRRHNIDIDTSCVGKGTCGLCRIRIVSGEDSLNPFSEAEEKHLGNVYFLTKVRLSCQTIVSGDVCVEVLPRKAKKPKKKSFTRR